MKFFPSTPMMPTATRIADEARRMDARTSF
jgi:hypothetical protein